MDEVHGVGGNGDYRIADARPEPYLFAQAKSGPLAEVHDLLIRSKPDVHKRDMLKPVFRTPEYCGTATRCRSTRRSTNTAGSAGRTSTTATTTPASPATTRGPSTSRPSARSCQDCHMPLVDAPLGDLAAKGGKVRSHQFFGPNTALPTIRGDQETVKALEQFLQKAPTGKAPLRVDVFAVKRDDGTLVAAPDLREIALQAGETVEIQVVVRNQDVGHTFPGGTLDSNEAWVHFRAADAQSGELLFESGAVDPKSLVRRPGRALLPRVVRQREERGGRQAQPARLPLARAPQGHRARNGRRRPLPLVVPEAGPAGRSRRPPRSSGASSARTTSSSRGRPSSPAGRCPCSRSPTSGRARRSSRSVAGNASGAGCAARRGRPSSGSGSTTGASASSSRETPSAAAQAFEHVAELQPDRVDGWRNLARTALDPSDGDPSEAIGFLQEAEQARSRGTPRPRTSSAVAREKTGQLDDAILALERAREDFPQDRTIHLRLGQLRYRLGRYDEALADFLRVLAIDPEDRAAHNGRLQIYLAMGDEKAAAEAKKAFLKYSIDESAQKWTNEFRRARTRT